VIPQRFTRRQLAPVAAFVSLTTLAGCRNGSPTIFGYQAGADALYDPNIRTIYVPVFSNRAFQTEPYRGMEVDITKAVVREIGAKTRFKVVSDPNGADTELRGNVVDISKTLLNRNQQNTIREGEIVLVVDVLWRDLRDGRVLSSPSRGSPPAPGNQPLPPAFDPDVPIPPQAIDQAGLPVRLVATGRLLPELGESNATASKRAVDLLATQIVSMMEKPW
jgi:hypothetical protein